MEKIKKLLHNPTMQVVLVIAVVGVFLWWQKKKVLGRNPTLDDFGF